MGELQKDITPSMRAILVDWLVEVSLMAVFKSLLLENLSFFPLLSLVENFCLCSSTA